MDEKYRFCRVMQAASRLRPRCESSLPRGPWHLCKLHENVEDAQIVVWRATSSARHLSVLEMQGTDQYAAKQLPTAMATLMCDCSSKLRLRYSHHPVQEAHGKLRCIRHIRVGSAPLIEKKVSDIGDKSLQLKACCNAARFHGTGVAAI